MSTQVLGWIYSADSEILDFFSSLNGEVCAIELSIENLKNNDNSSLKNFPIKIPVIKIPAIKITVELDNFSVLSEKITSISKNAFSIVVEASEFLANPQGAKYLGKLISELSKLQDKQIFLAYGREKLSATRLLEVFPYHKKLFLNGKEVNNSYFSIDGTIPTRERHENLLDDLLDKIGPITHSQSGTFSLANRDEMMGLLDAILDSMGDGVFVVDKQGTMLFCNRSSEEILGFGLCTMSLEERVRMFGNYLPDKVTPYPPQDLPIARAIKGINSDHTEIFIKNVRKPEGVWVSATGRPLRDRNGNICGGVVVSRNITSQKATEEERQKLESRLFQKQKLESLGLLAGGIAHDFNNLLMGVLGNAGLALLEEPVGSPARPRLEQIRTAATRLADLTNQLLAYAGKGSFVEEVIDLNDLVNEMQELLKTVVSKQADVRCLCSSRLPKLKGDSTQIRQVIMNLLTNASESLGVEGGLIEIQTDIVRATAEYLQDVAAGEDLKPGEYTVLRVRDNGSGMDEETVARIFDPFFTTKYRGRGLGLATVFGLVARHKGAVKVESKVGKGTTFNVLFPNVIQEEAPVSKSKSLPRAYRGTGTVLIVDDEEVVRIIAKEMLERFGFTVLTAGNGQEGVEQFIEHSARIVAVVLDMTMPDMSGEEVFNRMRAHRSDAPVIISSGYAERDTVRELTQDSMSRYLQKPYVPEMLIDKIRELIH